VNGEKRHVLILGGGLAGLSAGLVLARAGRRVSVLESDAAVGGLAKTIARGPFRFDLGGHRFFTQDKRIEAFLRELMDGELATVPRRSKILLDGKYFDYPLKPLNAVCGMGARAALRILFDYAIERARRRVRAPRIISLEDWVVSRFGRAMFRLFFQGYSEKIWGIDCHRICMEWVEQRIQGLSLGGAVRRALFNSRGRGVATLAEEFLYPPMGIGQIAERMRREVERESRVLTETRVTRLTHRGGRVEALTAVDGGGPRELEAEEVISTIPLPSLIRMLHPRPPEDVLDAAARLRYRDLVIVTVMVNRERVTDQTWMYIPDRRVPFSRIHEPTNWSARMAPEGQTLLVTEHFCFRGDDTWMAADEELSEITIAHLVGLGFIQRREVIDTVVVRVPRAYPLFEVGYRAHYDRICAYLGRFGNLRITGRSGTFTYLNMDHAIASGIDAGQKLLAT
ncbi:MAG: FAD-dependent oxidoreductase, partial [Candidatus Rokubacteria bacterium]|nr:FAD-dependent oxidoreductase [Candidatus Rokubacteria bacterium]